MEILTPDTKLTPHVTVSEYACRCGCGLGTHPEDVVWDTLWRFEEIRHISGDYPFLLGGCRCINHNKTVGGSPNSAHLRCSALDTKPLNGWGALLEATGITRDRFVEICEEIIGDGGVGRDLYGKFGIVHIDRDPELMASNPGRRW